MHINMDGFEWDFPAGEEAAAVRSFALCMPRHVKGTWTRLQYAPISIIVFSQFFSVASLTFFCRTSNGVFFHEYFIFACILRSVSLAKQCSVAFFMDTTRRMRNVG